MCMHVCVCVWRGPSLGRVVHAIIWALLYAAVLTFTPPVVNQLGGTPVLISGFCIEPGDFIGCIFDERPAPRAEMIDDSTFMCVTPLVTTLGVVDVELTKFSPPPRIEITANLITSTYVESIGVKPFSFSFE